MGAERPLPTRGAVAWTRQPPHFLIIIFFFLDKSRNLSKFVSVLLSASVERVGVSRIRDFFLINHATSPKLYWSYDPHRSRDSMSPVCRIFYAHSPNCQCGEYQIDRFYLVVELHQGGSANIGVPGLVYSQLLPVCNDLVSPVKSHVYSVKGVS